MDFAWLLVGLLAASVLTEFVELVSDNEPDPPVAPTIPGAGNSNGTDLLSGDLAGASAEDSDETQVDNLAAVQDEASYDDLPDAAFGAEDTGPNADAVEVANRIETEAESEAIWVGLNENAVADPAEVDDFQTGDDILYLALDAEMFEAPMNIEVVQSEDAQDSMVYISDELVAVLKNAPNASASDIYVKMARLAV